MFVNKSRRQLDFANQGQLWLLSFFLTLHSFWRPDRVGSHPAVVGGHKGLVRHVLYQLSLHPWPQDSAGISAQPVSWLPANESR